MHEMTSTRSEALAVCLILLVVISLVSATTNKDSGEPHHIQAEDELRGLFANDAIESRFHIGVVLTLSNGATTGFPDPILIECGSNAVPVLLEKENFDWVTPAACALTTDNKLECSNLLTKMVTYSGLVVEENTSFVVACRGTANSGADLDYLKVSLPASTYSMLEPALGGGSVGRAVTISRICDIPTFDGTSRLRTENYYPTSAIEFYPVCTGSDVLLNGCHGLVLCAYDDIFFAGEPCVNEPLPEMAQTVTTFPPNYNDPSVFACVFAVDPPALPALDTTYRADYTTGFAVYAADFGCDFDRGTLVVQCENGGIISEYEDADICQRVDASTQSCDASAADNAEGDISCTGSSLEQLAISVTWSPGDRESFQCPQNQFGVATISRSLTIGQKCPVEVTLARPWTYLGSADDIAVTCYPFASAFPDYISSETINTQTGQVVDADGYPYEFCLLVDSACFPDCGDKVPLTAMKAAIRPQHIDLECLFTAADGGGGGDTGNVNAAGGNTGTGTGSNSNGGGNQNEANNVGGTTENGGGGTTGGNTGTADDAGTNNGGIRQQDGGGGGDGYDPSSSASLLAGSKSRAFTTLCILCLVVFC